MWWLLLSLIWAPAVGDLSGIYDDSLDGIEYVYQAPSSRPPLGILFLLHGCSHSATDAWPRSESCESCIGLPVETTIVARSLERGWVVVAVSSQNRERKCWSGRRDVERIRTVYGKVKALTGAGDRVAAIGASSGGGMAAHLASVWPGLVAVAQIMPTSDLKTLDNPIRFVHMRRDAERADIIHLQVSLLKDRGVDAEELIVNPEPLTAEAFWKRDCLALSKTMAEELVAQFQRDGVIDEQGMIREDPRRFDTWRESAKKVVPATTDSLVADQSPVSELMNAKWAYHEFTDAYLDICLDWISTTFTRTPAASV